MRWKTRLAALAVVTGVAVGVVGSASATFGTPSFMASITPSTTLVAGAAQPFTVTVTNTSTGGWYAPTIKKVTVTPPSTASTAWASPVTKSLAYPYLKTGSSTTVGVNADVPCTTTGDWNVAVVFSYGSANPKTLTTTVSAPCTLAFGTQPQDALTNTLVTGLDFKPGGPPVTVLVKNGSGSLYTPPSGQVQLASPVLSAAVSGGVATFSSGLVFADPGTKTLAASAVGFSATGATSDQFEIIEFDTTFGGSICTDLSGDSTAVDCSSKTTDGVSKDTVANVDVVESTLNGTDVLVRAIPDAELGLCPTTYRLGRGELLVRPLAGTQLVEILMPKSVRQASTNNGVSQIAVCIETNASFITASGAPAAESGGVYFGVLPTCTSSDPQQPCVKTRESWSNGGARVVFVVPFVGGDVYDPKWGVN